MMPSEAAAIVIAAYWPAFAGGAAGALVATIRREGRYAALLIAAGVVLAMAWIHILMPSSEKVHFLNVMAALGYPDYSLATQFMFAGISTAVGAALGLLIAGLFGKAARSVAKIVAVLAVIVAGYLGLESLAKMSPEQVQNTGELVGALGALAALFFFGVRWLWRQVR